VNAFRRRVTEAGIVEAEELTAIDETTAQLMDDAVREAKAAPDPTPADVLTDVYVRY
jgi:pyruvate dehydrogenase E1 component alpha subunit